MHTARNIMQEIINDYTALFIISLLISNSNAPLVPIETMGQNNRLLMSF